MKSIRLSLVLYFLILLALALGAISLIEYQTTARTLQEKQDTNRQLLLTRYEERRREEIARLDNDLLFHARSLATIAQSQFEANRLYGLRFIPLGLIGAGPSPNAHMLAPLWVAELRDDRISDVLAGAVANEIQLNEDMLQRSEDRAGDFAQINSPRGRPWRSRTLGDASLPFDHSYFRRMKMFDWEFDDIELNGTQLRRVRLKVPIVRFRFLPPSVRLPFRGGGGGSRREFRSPQQQQTASVTNAAPFYIQWATDRSERDIMLADLEARTIEQLQQADADSHETLRRLRQRLIGISLAMFAAVCIGASVLVHVGLAPLSRLGEAVSRISADNFQLRYDGPQPPMELVPIVQRLQQTLTMLQRAFDREKQATADISHELRTPLAGLMTTIDVALRKQRSSEEYRQALVDCRDIVKQMGQMVERLLALSWLDARSDAVRNEVVDVQELAEQCAAIIWPLAKANDIRLTVNTETPVKVRLDAGKVREIISNLLHNAVEYNRPGGSIDLHVRTSSNGLELAVSDSGIGIAPEHRERIFERFFRADESRQATGIHAGLGLAIVRGYVDLLGGNITVDSEVGRGSTFRVNLPAAPSA